VNYIYHLSHSTIGHKVQKRLIDAIINLLMTYRFGEADESKDKNMKVII